MQYRIEIIELTKYGYEIIAPDESGQDICWESDYDFDTEQAAREAAERLIAEVGDAE